MTREQLEALETDCRGELDHAHFTVDQAMKYITGKPELLQSRGCVRLVLEAVDRAAYARGHEVGFQDGLSDADNACEEGTQHHEP